MIKLCAIASASLLPRYRVYRRFFALAGARILIKEECCYGGPNNASAILAARDEGIIVAEYQHGMISAGHDAYNFAPLVTECRAFRSTLPDYLLTYGAWWGTQVNAPVQTVVIGNPHRSERVVGTVKVQSERGEKILVLGDGVDTAAYLDLCERLAEALGEDFTVSFRPHPLERQRVRSQRAQLKVKRVDLDIKEDIYDSFASASVVVSEISTGLFEAVGIVPRVFVWDTPKARLSMPLHPFPMFCDFSDLLGMVRDGSSGKMAIDEIEQIWAPEWAVNFQSFVGQALQRPSRPGAHSTNRGQTKS